MAERRKRLDATQRQRLAGFLHDLPITLDHETAAQAWRVTTVLAEQFRLTVYIAAHLELAQRLILPLATLDLELRAAARQGRWWQFDCRSPALDSDRNLATW
jgi:predicted nucleic acid-binding protein